MEKYKRIIIINFSVVFILIGIPLFTILSTYYFLFPDGYFYEDKYFRAIHMKNTLDNKKTDIVFIGSSRVQSHISTSMFQEHGYEAYTYGRPNMKISDFPFPIQKSIDIKPRYIFLMVDFDDLYSEIFMQFPTYEDRRFYDSHFSYSTYNEYLSDKFRIKDLFRQSKKFIINKVLDRHDKFLASYDKNMTCQIDCDIIHWRGRKLGERSTALCSNGNTIAFDNHPALKSEKVLKKYKVENINNDKINLLNRLVDEIKNNGIIPVVVLEPTHYNLYREYDHAYIDKIVNAKVLHQTDFEVESTPLWIDITHLNIHGRKLYTEKIISVFDSMQ